MEIRSNRSSICGVGIELSTVRNHSASFLNLFSDYREVPGISVSPCDA